jgi:hypothetical protein
LNKTVTKALKAPEVGELPLSRLYLNKADTPLYISAMRVWIGKGSEIFSSAEIVKSQERWGFKSSAVPTSSITRRREIAWTKNCFTPKLPSSIVRGGFYRTKIRSFSIWCRRSEVIPGAIMTSFRHIYASTGILIPL